MDFIQANLIDPFSKVLYSYVLIYVLVAVGIYFTIRTKFVQIRYFGRMLNQVLHSRTEGDGISSFQAFCIGLASRVGTGNIAGVAIALTLGGPGAIFWMWVVAAIGMATALIEATLGQLFKVRARRRHLPRRARLLHPARAGLAAGRHPVRGAAGVHLRHRVQHAAGQRYQ